MTNAEPNETFRITAHRVIVGTPWLHLGYFQTDASGEATVTVLAPTFGHYYYTARGDAGTLVRDHLLLAPA